MYRCENSSSKIAIGLHAMDMAVVDRNVASTTDNSLDNLTWEMLFLVGRRNPGGGLEIKTQRCS